MRAAMHDDPKGYYERLEVDPWAPKEAIVAAYRRKARVLHPDIPETGNAAAFVAVKEAYEILADPLRRAAYDRSAKEARPLPPPPQQQRRPPQPSRARSSRPPPRFDFDDAEEIRPDPPPPIRVPKVRQPRLSDIPGWLWVVLIGAGLLAGGEAVRLLVAGPAPDSGPSISAKAPYVAPESLPVPKQPVKLAGTPNAYVVPAGGEAVVWRHDPATGGFVPVGHVPSFTAVQVVRMLPERGMVMVVLSHHDAGFIDASRVTPGNAETAHQAFCAYNAGSEPDNAEVLQRHGSGPAAVTLVNRSGEPAVVKLRTAGGVVAASVYLAPNGTARVSGLPAQRYQPEYAVGELWSRACHNFAAGMEAQRFSRAIDLSKLSSLSIPPDLLPGVHSVDISNHAFEQP